VSVLLTTPLMKWVDDADEKIDGNAEEYHVMCIINDDDAVGRR